MKTFIRFGNVYMRVCGDDDCARKWWCSGDFEAVTVNIREASVFAVILIRVVISLQLNMNEVTVTLSDPCPIIMCDNNEEPK
jgi:hypothetical protein